MAHAPRATVDFETRSVLDVRRVGPYAYAKHPSTQILMLAYHVPGMKEPKLWHRGFEWEDEPEPPHELFEWIANGGLVEAHNNFFEWMIWLFVAMPQHGWPEIPFDQWRCSAAKASAHALPRALEDLAVALNLREQKDVAGHRYMLKVTKPKKLTKDDIAIEGKGAIIFIEDESIMRVVFKYCIQDVRTEIAASREVPDLNERELKIWQLNQRANLRGIQIDTALCKAALKMAGDAKAKMNEELGNITGGLGGGQRDKLKKWLVENEKLDLADSTAKTLDWYVERVKTLSPRAKRVLELMRTINRTSVNKYKRMLEAVDHKGIARELIKYCGAERTGRFSGQGIQVHNFPKGDFGERNISMDDAVADIKAGDVEWCEIAYGDIMGFLSSALRGALMPRPGKELWIADYAAIEARVVLWQAGATAALLVFERGEDIYCDMASTIYGRTITKDDKNERQFGKQAILGLGYGMGWIKFLITCRGYKIFFEKKDVLRIMGKKNYEKYALWVRKKLWPAEFAKEGDDPKKLKSAVSEGRRMLRQLEDEREVPKAIIHELALMKYTVDVYRSKYDEVPDSWKAMEAAAIKAVRDGGVVKCGVVSWYVKGRFLYCKLPSGRRLSYVDPELKMQKTAWGESKPTLRFMGIDQKTRKWTRQHTYGGKLIENITQAMARDIMADAMVRVDDSEIYELLITVHDELVSEADIGTGDKEEYTEIVSAIAPYFEGCPVAAETGKPVARYRK